MITEKGALYVDRKKVFYPFLEENEFLETSLGGKVEKDIFNEGYHTYRVIGLLDDVLECKLTITFYNGILRKVHFLPLWPHLTGLGGWETWSLENELAIKAKNDEWLESHLGLLPYQYEWGEISSEYDAKSGGSDIVILYYL